MTALVFLHGFTGSPRNFQPLIEQCPLGMRVFAPALIGHDPEQDHQTPSTERFEDEVDRLAAALVQHALPPVHLIGYSLGARIALGLAVRHRELVARATLIGVHPGLQTSAEREQRRASDAEWCALIQSEGVPAFVEAWQNQPLFASQAALPERVRELQRQQRLRHSAAGLCLSLRSTGLAEMPSYWPALAELALPVDLVTGALDERFSSLASAAHALLPESTLHSVAGVGHNVILENPSALAGIVGSSP